jgi:predicted nucleotidyltransferase component of viral defense system
MYAREMTEASKSALLELGLSLKRYHDDIVLTGGWAPYFIAKGYFEHCGSIDIDLALRTKIMPRYDTILKTMENLGYVAQNSFRFLKKVRSPVDGKDYDIHLDFLCEKEGLRLAGLRNVQEGLDAFAFDGLGLAFDFNFEQNIEAVLPGNGTDETTFKVVSLPGSLALKGLALKDRAKPKDSYDIFSLTHYNGGPVQAAEHFNELVSDTKMSSANLEFLRRSIGYVRSGFKDATRRGPFHVETFTESRFPRSVVVARVNTFLGNIRLPE